MKVFLITNFILPKLGLSLESPEALERAELGTSSGSSRLGGIPKSCFIALELCN